MEFASEMVVKAALQKQRMSEVPVVLYPDGRDRPPHLRSFRDGWRHLRFLLLMCPLWLFFIPSLLITAIGMLLMIWLTPGPRQFRNFVLDLHSLLFGSLLVILGYQTTWLWLFAKIHAWIEELLPPDKLSQQLFDYITLERGLVTGTVVLLAGLGLNSWLCYSWWDYNFGPLEVQVTMRKALWGSALMILGVQTIYGSFFLSLLRMTKDCKAQRPGITVVS